MVQVNLGNGNSIKLMPYYFFFQIVSVITMGWARAHHMFVVEIYS